MKKILIFLLISFTVFFMFSANLFSQEDNGEENTGETNNNNSSDPETDDESNVGDDDSTNGNADAENNDTASTNDSTNGNAEPENTGNDDGSDLEDDVLESVPLGYTVEPHITNVDINGIVVEWETNKDTDSVLYIGDSANFDISNAIASFVSEKKRIHSVTATLDNLDPEKEYYLKTQDTNLNDSEDAVISAELSVKLNDKLVDEYNNQVKDYGVDIDAFVSALQFKEASDKTEELISIMESYSEFLDMDNEEKISKLNDTLYRLEIATRAKDLMDVANDFAKKKVFESALDKYKEVKELVISKNIEDLIARELLDEKIYQMETAVEVITLIQHADKLVESELYDEAKEKYDEALKLIMEAGLEELISVQEINRKKRDLSRSKVPKVHFIGGMGTLTNFDNFFDKDYTFMSWYGFIAFRFSRVFAFGLGINTTLFEAYLNFSLMNTYSVVKKFNHEIYLRLGGLVNFPFWKETTFAGAGGEVTLGYQFGIGRYFGVTLDVGTMIFYNLYGKNNLNIIPTMNIGVVLSLGT